MSTTKRFSDRIGIDPHALVGLSVIGIGLFIWLLAFSGFFRGFLAPSTYTVKASFSSIEDIASGDPVRIDGVQVGTVSKISPSANNRAATLTMQIEKSDHVYANASAQIVWKTVLGGIDAVQLTPGTRAAGNIGGQIIPESRDANQVELDEITQGGFSGAAQPGIRTMLQELPIALEENPTVIADDFATLVKIAPEATTGVGALRGEVKDTDLKNLVRDAASTANALNVGTAASQTRNFVQEAAGTVSAVAANPVALRETIDDLSIVLPLAHSSFHTLDATLSQLNPLVTKLSAAAPAVAPTFASLHPAVTQAGKLLTDADPLVHRLSPAVTAVAAAAKTGVPVIDQISPGLDDLNNTFLPGMLQRYPEDGGRPAVDALGGTVDSLGPLAGFFDQNHKIAYLTAGLSVTDTQGLQYLPCTEDFTGQDLLVCQTLSQSLQLLLTGGTSLLSSLVKKPGAVGASYKPLLTAANRDQNALSGTLKQLGQVAPDLVGWLTKPNHGKS